MGRLIVLRRFFNELKVQFEGTYTPEALRWRAAKIRKDVPTKSGSAYAEILTELARQVEVSEN